MCSEEREQPLNFKCAVRLDWLNQSSLPLLQPVRAWAQHRCGLWQHPGVGFGSIGVGFVLRAGGVNIAVGLGLAGCPAAGDTGEAEDVGELWEAAVAKEAFAARCFLSWSF